ncbi:hypothetical protein TYRP_014977 [Tyrophagus putrescentiae]|nr:hypothetical protein TYRP_014977 [Tyrophagus putrescentiae]
MSRAHQGAMGIDGPKGELGDSGLDVFSTSKDERFIRSIERIAGKTRLGMGNRGVAEIIALKH